MIVKTKIIFNRDLDKYKKGDKIEIELNGYWRNRLKDKDISLFEEKEDKKEENNSEKTNEIKETKKRIRA